MSRCSVFLVLCLLAPAIVAAQEQAVQAPLSAAPLLVPEERARIQRARLQVTADAEQANAACYQKFAVSDCQRQVRANKRLVMDELRRQEVILNDLARQGKAFEALKKIEEKSLGGAKRLEINP